ncbi:MAG: gliding motility-associated C-terminal domain-containing protein [Bacteroidota bacterium]
MKRIFIILFLLTALSRVHAQQVSFEWVQRMRGTGPTDARAESITTDAAGNVYVTGFFTDSVDFDPGPGVYSMTPVGKEELYILKLNAAGKLLWARQMVASFSAITSHGKAIAVDAAGNIFVTGDFLDANNMRHCLIFKLDNSGNFVWTNQIGETSDGNSIKIDASGNIFIAGVFSGIADFDPGPNVFTINNLGFSGAFVLKLAPAGSFMWVKVVMGVFTQTQVFGGITDQVSMAVDKSGNICISGVFTGVVDFNPESTAFTLTSTGTTAGDIFVLKIDGSGKFVWARQIGGDNIDVSESIEIDESGSIYTSGNFNGTADFDPGDNTFNLTTGAGNSEIFISKLDGNGNFVWAKQISGGQQICYSTALDNHGNLLLTGYFGDVLDFDPGPGIYNLSATVFNVFILKLNGAGNFVWAKKIGGSGSVISNSITTNASGNVYIAGYFLTGVIDFDPGVETSELSAGEGDNIFVQKMSPCPKFTSSTLNIATCKPYTLNGQAYNRTGIYTQTTANAEGCDSVITLNLTINLINELIDTTVCTSFKLDNHTYFASGNYTETLTTTGGCDSIITLHLAIIGPSATNLSKSICAGQSFEGYSASGTYIDTLIAASGCDSIRILKLSVLPKPSPDLGEDIFLCPGDSLKIYPGQFDTYTWQDGSVQTYFTVTKPGLYSVTVTDKCNSANDALIVKEGTCGIYFPTAFTPNNDGKNDLFRIRGAHNLTEYHLSVYNRFGQEVFESSNYSSGWDGNFKGRMLSMETFVWYCEFKKQGDQRMTKMKGTVTLVK